MANRIISTDDIIISRGGIRWNQFANFEQGALTPNPTGFDSIAGAGQASLTVSSAAALRGNFGLSVAIPNTQSKFGLLIEPDLEKELTLNFFLDINSLI